MLFFTSLRRWIFPRRSPQVSRLSSRRLRRQATLAVMEGLEERVLLSTIGGTFSASGSSPSEVLNVSLNTANTTLSVASAGSTYTLTLSSGTWTGSGANVSANGSVLTVSTLSAFASGSINITDTAAGDSVTFADSGANTYSTPFTVTLDGTGASGSLPGFVSFNGNTAFANNAGLNVTTTDNIAIASGANVSTANANLSLSANLQATPTTGFSDGIDVFGTVRVTGSGGLSVRGRGGLSQAGRNGVYVAGTIQGGTAAGSTLVQGTGGPTSFAGYNQGVVVDGGSITSSGASVTVNGTGGGTGSTASNYGVILQAGGTITAGGTGAVTVTGTGGATSGNYNEGVLVYQGTITSGGGNVSVTGTGGGSGASSDSYGVEVASTAGTGIITSGGSGTVSITGSGSAAQGASQFGVLIGRGGVVRSGGTGAVTIVGTGGGTGAGYNGVGVVVDTGATVTSGTNGSVSIAGTGGAGSNGYNLGILVGATAAATVTTGGGDLVLTGREGTGTTNVGIGITSSSTVSTRTNGGNLTLTSDTIKIVPAGVTISTPDTATLTVKPRTSGTNINLGTDYVDGGPLNLPVASLNAIQGTGTLYIGSATTGTITITDTVSQTPQASDLVLESPAGKGVNPTKAGLDFNLDGYTLSFASGTPLNIRINGSTLDTGYDQLNAANDPVDITGATLALSGTAASNGGDVLTIVSAASLTGTFTGLANNATIATNGKTYRINYTATAVTLTDLSPSITTQPTTASVNVGATATFTAAATGTPTPTVQWQRQIPTTGASSYRVNTVTQGNWKGMFGTDGYNIIGNAVSYPSYATVTTSGTNSYTWADPTADVRGLQYAAAGSTNRIAACWYSSALVNATMTVDVNLTDGQAHAVSLYLMDWDGVPARSARIDVVDVATGATIDSQTLGNYQNGTYVTWNVSGHVRFNIVNLLANSNAVISGIFFDGIWNNIAGATSNSYTTAATTSAMDTYQYRAVFTNTNGSSTTNAATLRVNTVPVIGYQPQNATVIPGTTVAFYCLLSSSSGDTTTIQWQKSTNGGTSWTNVAGSADEPARLDVTPAAGDGNFQVRAIWSSSAGSVTSSSATGTITNSTYYIYPYNNGFELPNQGSGLAAYTINPATGWTGTVVTGNPGVAANGSAFNVTGAANQNANPAGTTSTSGQAAFFQGSCALSQLMIMPAGSLGVVNFALEQRNSGTVNTNNITVFIDDINLGTYTTATSNSFVGFRSNPFTLTQAGNHTLKFVSNNPNGGDNTIFLDQVSLQWNAVPAVVTQPTSTTVLSGATATFTASATGEPTPTVQWQEKTSGSNTWNNIPGATSTTYTKASVSGLDSGSQYRAVFTNTIFSTNYTATTDPATLTIAVAPAITTQPSNVFVTNGGTVTIVSAASGTPTPTVQWQYYNNAAQNWVNWTGGGSLGNTPTLTFAPMLPVYSGSLWHAVYTNMAGTTTTSSATLTLATAPAVTTQPGNQSVTAGNNATFTVAASGTPTPTVQWQVSSNGTNWSDISGATSLTYSFTTAAGDTGKQYHAVFTNMAGTVTTNPATLTVNTLPVVTTQPTGQTVNSGSTATFTAAASGTPSPTVQWQEKTSGSNTWNDIPGATSTTYTTGSVSGLDDGSQFRAVFTNVAATVNTNAVTLTVATAPAVTTQPGDQTVTAGNTATFTVAASGTPTPTVQWQVSTNGTDWSDISGATSLTYSFTTAAGDTGKQYHAVFTNMAGTVTTNPATLTVNSTPAVTTQPTNQNVIEGNTGTFTADATGTPTPTVQWQTALLNAASFRTDSTTQGTWKGVYGSQGYSIFADATSLPAYMTLVKNNPFSMTYANPTSDTRALQKAAVGSTQRVLGQWYNGNTPGDAFTVNVNLTDGQAHAISFYLCSWSTDTPITRIDLSDTVTGERLDSRTFSNYQNGRYATWNVKGNVTFRFAVASNYSANSGYCGIFVDAPNWVDIPNATSTTYTTPTQSLSDSGTQYRAVFTNTVASVPTTGATLTVITVPAVTTQPVDTGAVAGGTATFTAAASGVPTPAVQWQVNAGSGWSDISGATSATYSFTASASDDGHQYRAVFTNAAGTATSNAATFTTYVLPVVTTQPADTTVNPGETATFTAQASGTPTPTVQWQQFSTSPSWGAGTEVTNTTTSGNWKGVFGGQGYTIIGDATSYPAYASVVRSGGNEWVWDTNPSDTRELQVAAAGSSNRIAGVWYSTNNVGDSFTVNVNLSDNLVHAVSFYLLDFDGSARSERIELISNGQVLDSQTFSNFNNGVYATWNVKGNVSFRFVNLVQGWNSVVTGVFLDQAGWSNIPGATSNTYTTAPVSVSDSGTQYRAVFTNLGGKTSSDAASLLVNSVPVITAQPADATVNAGTSTTFTATAIGAPTAQAQWQVNSGSGWQDISGATSASYTFTPVAADNGNQYRVLFTNSNGTTTSNAAALTVNYLTVTTQPVDAAVLTGSTATFTTAASANPAATVQWQQLTTYSTTNAASFRTNTTTSGNWKGVFGSQGYNVLGSGSSYPAYASVARSGGYEYLNWAEGTTTETRALEPATGSSTNRTVGVWYTGTNANDFFDVNVNMSDGLVHAVSLYLLDWDSSARTERISLISNGQTLDTQTFSNFHNGTYATWNVQGNVTFRIKNIVQGMNSVISGLFIDGGWNNISGATSTSYTTPTVTANDFGSQYRAAFTNAVGTVTTNAATLTQAVAPAVTTNPSSTTVTAGSTATFTAAASGNPSPTVQWQVSSNGTDWSDISGATSATYSFTAAAGDTGKQYHAVFTNFVGSATTTAATLTVNVAPVVTTQPSNQVVAIGSTATFTAAASGTPSPTVQWQVSSNGTSWSNISGATSPTFSFTVAAGNLDKQYHAVFTNSAGTATSNPATLSAPVAPAVTTNPVNTTGIAGNTVTFTADASGAPTPGVQWQKYTPRPQFTVSYDRTTQGDWKGVYGSGGYLIAGNSASFAPNVSVSVGLTNGTSVYENPSTDVRALQKAAPDSGRIASAYDPTTGVVPPSSGDLPWSRIRVSVNLTDGLVHPVTLYAVDWASAGLSQTVFIYNGDTWEATPASFSNFSNGEYVTIYLTGHHDLYIGANPNSYATLSGVFVGAGFEDIPGATSTSYTTPNLALSDAGTQYRAVFTNSAGTATTTAATLDVISVPAVTTQPVDTGAVAGSTVSFTAAASGVPTPTVQWQVNAGSGWSDISGATSATYSFTAAAGDDAKQFRAVFTNTAGTATTNAATFSLYVLPVVTTQPAATTNVNAGNTATFTANATGTPTPTVQWQSATATPTWGAGTEKTDTTTSGNWKGVFGSQGYKVLSGATSFPAYASVARSGGNEYLNWAEGTTTETRALEPATGPTTNRTVGVWYTNTGAGNSLDVNVTLTDNQVHAVSLYLLDWDSNARTERIDVISNGQTIDSQTFSNFHNGIYATWDVKGNVTFRIVNIVQGLNSVVSGVFMDEGGWTNIPGANSTTYTTAPVSVPDTGTKYRAVFTNAAGKVNSDTSTLGVYGAPLISTQPAATTANAGSTATFTAAAIGLPTAQAQWQVNSGSGWQDISGATSPTYSFTPVAADNGNQYRAVFTNTNGTATSNAAALTVNYLTVSTQPVSTGAVAGATATFTADASANPAATVQWQKLTTYSTTNAASFRTDTTTQGNWKGVYGSQGYNTIGDTVSYPSYVTVTSSGVNVVNNWSGNTNQVRALQLAAAGSTGRRVGVWYSQPNNVGSNYTLDVNMTDGLVHAVSFYLIDWDTSVRSERIDVKDVTSNTSIDSQTVSNFHNGTYVTWNLSGHVSFKFTNLVANTNAAISAIFFDGGWNNIAGATSTSYTTPAMTANDDGSQYRAVFTNTVGSVATNAATLTLNVVPAVTTNPASTSVYAGTTATFTAGATGTPTPTVQWQASNDSGSNWINISGASSNSYTTPVTSTGDSGTLYRAVFTNAAGSVPTDAATLTVTNVLAPVVTTNPANASVTAGATATFTAAASGTPTPTVQWQKLDAAAGSTWTDIGGATGTSYTTPVTTGAYNGAQYRAVFTNAGGVVRTSAATLTVQYAPVVSGSPSNSTVSVGGTATFTAAANANPAPTVQWQVSTNGGTAWANISGATSTTYSFTATAGQDGNQYRAVFINNLGSAATGVATLRVNQGPAVTGQPASVTTNSGSTATFTAVASGSPAPTVQWQKNSGSGWSEISGATSASYTTPTLTNGDTGTQYRAVFTNNLGTATTNAATLTIAVVANVSRAAVGWGTQLANLVDMGDGRLLPAGRTTDIPWLGINKILITLDQAIGSLTAGNITLQSAGGYSYSVTSVSPVNGSGGTIWTINLGGSGLANPDKVTVTVGGPSVASYSKRLDVLPGDVNDDGLVSSLDQLLVSRGLTGQYIAFYDIDGTGTLTTDDVSAIRSRIGNRLPR